MAQKPAKPSGGADRFFIIGAQRSGTTSLWHALDAHPLVEMAKPSRPEPKHFLDANSTTAAEIERYEAKYFPGHSNAVLYGEKSTSYLEYGVVAGRIKAAYPMARVIVSLREPVERAVSNYWFTVANGLEERPLEVALNEPPPDRPTAELSTSPFDYVRRSRYDELLPPWISAFGNRLCIVILEEASANGWRDVAAFLDLEPNSIETVTQQNEAPRFGRLSADLEAELAAKLEPSVSWVRHHLGRQVPGWSRGETQSTKDVRR